MIINIHGFGGEGNNSKYKWLRENIPQHEIYSPTFTYGEDPADILKRLLDKVSSCGSGLYIVGNSLGGFFANVISRACPLAAAILINPSLTPFLTLREELGADLCRKYLNILARYAYGDCGSLHVIIGDADERIDHRLLTLPLLPPDFENLHVIRGGTHRMAMTPEVEVIFKSVITVPDEREVYNL